MSQARFVLVHQVARDVDHYHSRPYAFTHQPKIVPASDARTE